MPKKTSRKASPRARAGRRSGERSPLWSGRFTEPVSERVQRYTASIGFDSRLAAQDIEGSLAYFEMFERDRQRLIDCRKRLNVLPLGAAALAGTTYPIRRERVARELGFDAVSENSLDAVSDRDFAIEFCACASVAMVHVSRL